MSPSPWLQAFIGDETVSNTMISAVRTEFCSRQCFLTGSRAQVSEYFENVMRNFCVQIYVVNFTGKRTCFRSWRITQESLVLGILQHGDHQWANPRTIQVTGRGRIRFQNAKWIGYKKVETKRKEKKKIKVDINEKVICFRMVESWTREGI